MYEKLGISCEAEGDQQGVERAELCFFRGIGHDFTSLANLLNRYQNPTLAQIEAFVRELQEGQSALDDLHIEDRSRSLTSSLQIGFATLNHGALRRLALLYLFRRYANVNVLFGMFRGTQEGVLSDTAYNRNWTLREFAEDAPTTLDRVLQRAAEVGLLRRPKAQHHWRHPHSGVRSASDPTSGG